MYVVKIRMTVLLTAFFAVFVTESAYAADTSELVNIAGRQRMLSQRVAKAYFYHGIGIAEKESRIQLDMSLTRFKNGLAELKNVEDTEIQEMLSYIELTFSGYKELVNKPYSRKNAPLVLELSETLLESSHEVVLRLEKMSNRHLDSVINISGRQRMLSQRVAKYYIAYQAGFQDDDTVQKLKTAAGKFESALEELRKEERNTKQIDVLLDKMKKHWEQIEPYFLQVRKGGLPLMVLTNTDEMTSLAHKVTGLYVEETASK